KITILAESVPFTRRGRLVLETAPALCDGVRIISKSLDLTQARAPFFSFPTIWPQWPVGTPARMVEITSAQVLTGLPVPPSDWINYFESKTLDPELGITNRGAFSIDVGTNSASAFYLRHFAEDMTWPTATATKILRHFSQTPYDRASRDFMKLKVNELSVELPDNRFDYAKSLLGQVSRALAQENDLAGRSAFYVPRQDYTYLIDYFNTANEDTFQTLNLWVQVLADILAGNAASQSRAQLRSDLAQQNAILLGQTKDVVVQIETSEQSQAVLQEQLDHSLATKLASEQARLDSCLTAQAHSQQKKAQLAAIT